MNTIDKRTNTIIQIIQILESQSTQLRKPALSYNTQNTVITFVKLISKHDIRNLLVLISVRKIMRIRWFRTWKMT